ncbi:MAG TPA: flagellar basal-body rod protein FlgF [Terriglobales bacterium]|nr:flagellar basal-body rod protein FlgF [Terriglobales bacterium]
MDSGYYAACAGLRTQTQALDVLANNLANTNTVGYRSQQPTFHSILASAHSGLGALNRAINDYNVLGGDALDLTAGSLQQTGNPLDLALEGDGFFAIKTAAGTLYTRNGNFQASAQNQLTTAEGDPVLGEQGPITLPGGTISISTDGTLSVDGAVAGKLKMVEFVPGTSPEPAGNSYYSAPETAVRPAAGTALRQGMLEASNVDPVAATVALITLQRHAEMLGRALSSFYSDLDRIAADELPRVS